MRDHVRGWSAVGGSLLLAAASHGWILLLGVAVILGVTYLAAYVLLLQLKDWKIEGATIITPFLTIKARLGDYDDATSADDEGTGAQPGVLKQVDDGAVTCAIRKKRSAGKRSHRKYSTRQSKHAMGSGSLQPFSANSQKPYHPALDMHVLRFFGSLVMILARALKMILSVPNSQMLHRGVAVH
jgi:hypothetical protein